MSQSSFPVANINNWKEVKTAPGCYLATQLQSCLRWSRSPLVDFFFFFSFCILQLIYSLCSNHLKQAAKFITHDFCWSESPEKKTLITLRAEPSCLWFDFPVCCCFIEFRTDHDSRRHAGAAISQSVQQQRSQVRLGAIPSAEWPQSAKVSLSKTQSLLFSFVYQRL